MNRPLGIFRRLSPLSSRPRLIAMSSPNPVQKSSATAFSSSSSPSRQDSNDNAKNHSDDKALPAPADGGEHITLDVSGDGTTVKLDGLGPMVVNVDGSMSRINNWTEMTEAERENSLRIVGKRNQKRLAALRLAKGHKKEP